ncbi:uncharacterized protein LOC116001243 [Ipomoea triloba]|uniref:uncharacterized protein LOC116001243 n=1 Tax=Ipomoea triloba TaxID=35885 RepID=UPI00125E1995|nr:uncharacterized protein LOC116001243 [Ipomoea triloba]
MEGSLGASSNCSGSSTVRRKCYLYGECISVEVCGCGQEMVLRTSWTNENPGRRYWECSRHKDGFMRWYDPPMCPRSKRIIPGLLRRINKIEEENVKLKSKLRSLGKILKSNIFVGVENAHP